MGRAGSGGLSWGPRLVRRAPLTMSEEVGPPAGMSRWLGTLVAEAGGKPERRRRARTSQSHRVGVETSLLEAQGDWGGGEGGLRRKLGRTRLRLIF